MPKTRLKSRCTNGWGLVGKAPTNPPSATARAREEKPVLARLGGRGKEGKPQSTYRTSSRRMRARPGARSGSLERLGVVATNSARIRSNGGGAEARRERIVERCGHLPHARRTSGEGGSHIRAVLRAKHRPVKARFCPNEIHRTRPP